MVTTQSATEERAESIISGPRKGEFITIPNGESELTSEAEASLDSDHRRPTQS